MGGRHLGLRPHARLIPGPDANLTHRWRRYPETPGRKTAPTYSQPDLRNARYMLRHTPPISMRIIRYP